MTPLEAQIREAFPIGEPFHGCPTDETYRDPEYDRVRLDFTGKRWDEIPHDALIEYHFDTIPLLSQAACKYFLPAFLLAAVRPEARGRDGFVVQALSPPWYRWVPSDYTVEQRSAVIEMLSDYDRRYPGTEAADALLLWRP